MYKGSCAHSVGNISPFRLIFPGQSNADRQVVRALPAYIRMLGGSGKMEKLLRERAGTTVLVNDADAACVEDIGKRLLLKIDTNAEKLYTA